MVIPARNESRFIEDTLKAIGTSAEIIVVDDGSTDNTAEIAKKYVKKVVKLSDGGYNAVGKPALASVINKGLELCLDSDYICVLGADHILPSNYLSIVIERMKRDNVIIASGMIKGEFQNQDFPWGSGRVVDGDFWRGIGLKYPEKFGWEDWLVYKALQMGRNVRCYLDIVSRTQRPMSFKGKGEIMYALGYYWPYAIGRCIHVFLRSPSDGLNMLGGFLIHKGVERLDVAPWVNNYQRSKMKQKLQT